MPPEVRSREGFLRGAGEAPQVRGARIAGPENHPIGPWTEAPRTGPQGGPRAGDRPIAIGGIARGDGPRALPAGAPPTGATAKEADEGPASFAWGEPAGILGAMEGGGLDQNGAMPGRGSESRPVEPAPATPSTSGDHVFNPSALEDLGTPGPSGGSAPERITEVGLRPVALKEFVGQGGVVENLRVHLDAAMERDEPPDHVLFSGPPGLGKTSLARIMAGELGTSLQPTSGPALDKPRDLVGLLTSLKRGDVLFIDEIHRLPIAVEEYLYTAMEDFRVEMTLDSGPHARILPIELEPFTLVGATTREGLLSAPFRARFGLSLRLDPYPAHELEQIVRRAARILKVQINDEAAAILAERSRGTPRIAGRFLKRVRDRAQIDGNRAIDAQLAEATLRSIGVDGHGLEEMDRRILRCLADHAPLPAALKTIAAVVGEMEDTIEDVFEPHLLRSGFLRKTPRGRMITEQGLRLIGAEPPLTSAQDGLPFTT